ncbi:F-box domain-containing protein [Heracleum sosnowskyi]|uniref:F-box domain-containing protein n=1 Tax=Heracleum sosnowskyi TaxID=360622 RepID=A0AAD8HV01_9APIA|nr:F-box domain-containing protein [Heracleum sosnowskyi]
MQYRCGEAEQETPLIIPEFTVSQRAVSFYAACDNEEGRMIQAAKIPMAKFEVKGSVCGSCNGLMYFAEFGGVRIVVSNPLRSQFKILPSMSIGNYCPESDKAYGLGFDTSTKTFKMVCTIYEASTSRCTLVHTLGTTSWREVSKVPSPYILYGEPVFVHGFLHWLAEPSSTSENCQGRIMAFDVSKETFKLIPHPEICLDKDRGQFRVLDIKGNLAMFDLSCNTKIDIWVVMDYDNKLWSRDYTVRIDTPLPDHMQVIGMWKQDEILLTNNQGYFSYSLKTDDLKYKHTSGFSSSEKVYTHRGSLISISDVLEAA